MHCKYWADMYGQKKKSVGKSEAQSSATNGDLNRQYLKSLDFKFNSDKHTLTEYLQFCNSNNCY